MFYNTLNGEYPVYAWQIRRDHPNTSFTSAFVPPPEYVPFVTTAEPQANIFTHKVIEDSPTLTDGKYVQTWRVVLLSADEATAVFAAKKDWYQSMVDSAVQAELDKFVATRGYSSMLSCVSYANSTTTKFQQEALYAMQWRDAVWLACQQILNATLAGERDIPTTDEVLAELPVPVWPL